MTRLMILLTLAITAAVIATGCGNAEESSDSGQSVTTSSLTPNQYAKKANEICRHGRETFGSRVAAYEKNHGSQKGKPQEVAYAEKIQQALIPYLKKEIGKLRALGAPQGDEETVEAILAAQQSAIDDVLGLHKLSDKEGALESHFAEANALMRDYGVDECTAR